MGKIDQDRMAGLHLLHVFTDANGNFGDTASAVIDEGKHIPDAQRQAIAAELNTGETIFINDLLAANISVMHPQGEIGFAGVGILGTAWLLARLRDKPTRVMHGREGNIQVHEYKGLTWLRANIATMPPWHHDQFESPGAVEQLMVDDMKDTEHTMVWAWINEAKGLIRARTFANDWDIPEAQANGSGSMMLAVMLGRELEIRHGDGSVIFAKPAEDNQAELGGRVTEDKQRSTAL